MSFLFAMFHGGGNVHLIMPIVRRLTRRGHRVRVLVGPRIWIPRPPPATPLLDLIISAGATAIPLLLPSENPHQTAPRQPGLVRGWAPGRLRKARNLGIASWWAPVWAAAMAAELGADRPDAVVADYFLLGALAAAEQAAVPTGVLVHNATYVGPLPGLPPPNTGFGPEHSPFDRVRDMAWAFALRFAATRNALPSLNDARAKLGLPLLRSPFEQYEAANRVLILSSQAFDFRADRLPSNVRYVGTPFDDSPRAQWTSPWPADDLRPLVLVSLSTLNQGQGRVMQRILDAVGRLSVRALVTLGPSLDVADFKAPPNARLEAFIPHAAVLPEVAAVITQCGLSTVSKALAHGVPLLCIPLSADQPDNAARVVAAGAGIRLGRDASDGQIAAALARILKEERYLQGARRMARLMSVERADETAADELERLAGIAARSGA